MLNLFNTYADVFRKCNPRRSIIAGVSRQLEQRQGMRGT